MKRTKVWALIIGCPFIFGSAQAPALPLAAQPVQAQTVAATKAAPLSPDKLTARSAILMDADSGRVLFEKDADAQRAPASTTKIMTLWLAAERGGLNEVVTVPDSAGKAPAGSSLTPVYPGEKMPYKDLLYGLAIKSGNDAANAIGTLVAGSVDGFVDMMNQRAAQLGLKNTHFENAHGYPEPGHYSSARDLATLTRAAFGNQTVRTVLTDRSHTMAATAQRGKLTLHNGYAILDPDSPYYYAPALGGKTGYASAAGQCFVCVARKGGHTLISAVLNAGGTKTPKWTDTKTLFQYGFKALDA